MKRYFISLVFAGLFVSVQAQKMEELFIKMPNDMIVQLEEAWRKDLADLYKSGKPAVLENTMMGKSVLQKLTDHYLMLQTTERSVVELRLLPLINNTYIICMIETVYAPIADSRVSFYTTDWQPLSAESIFTPVTEDWFWKEDANESSLTSDIFLVKYSLSDEHENLTAEYMTPLYLDDENQQIVKAFLKADPKIYEWKYGRFE